MSFSKVPTIITTFLTNSKYLYIFLISLNIYGALTHILMLYLRSSDYRANYIGPRFLKGYIAFNVILLILLLFKKSFVLSQLERFCSWNTVNGFKREKSIISICVMGIIIIFCLKLRAGFYFSGIIGWVTSDLSSKYKAQPLRIQSKQTFPSFLYSSLIKKNLQYLPFEYNTVTLSVQFLHYKDKVLPINYDITPYAFDHIIVNSLRGKGKLGVLNSILKNGLELKKKNWFYPSYISYMKLDVTTYPTINELKMFSSWLVTFHIDRKEELISITNATERVKHEFN